MSIRATGSIIATIIAAFTGTACVLNPTDELQLCGTNGASTFSGFTLNASEDVELQWASSPSGPYTTFATTRSSSASTTVGRTQLYAWQTSVLVPGWRSTAAGYEVFVRARLAGTSNSLITFDTANSAGQTPIQCLAQQLDLGRTATEAGYNCRSADSPVLHLTAPTRSTCACPITYDGTARIDSSTSASRFSCLVTLNGDLEITSTAPDSISLPALTSVTGAVSIDYSTSSGAARAVQIPALPTINGSLSLRGVIGSGSVDLGLNAIASINGNVLVDFENTASSGIAVTGLNQLSYIPLSRSIRLRSRGAFTSLGLLANFKTTETVFIESVALDPTRGQPLTLRELTYATDLVVTYPAGLTAMPNNTSSSFSRELLPKLESAGYLNITNDPFYPAYGSTSVPALNRLPKLTSVGLLQLEGTQLSGLDIGAASLSLRALTLRNNSALQTLNRPGLAFATPAGPLTIVNNPALRQCDAVAFAAGYGGTVTISGNNPAGCGACGPMAYAGSLVIDSPVAATTHRCVSSVSGSFSVAGHPRMGTIGFPQLSVIGGDANLVYTMGNYQLHGDRRSIDLPVLTSIGGNLVIDAHYKEIAPTAFSVGMPQLTTIGGSIDYYANNGSLSGLPALTTHAGNIYVHGPNLDVQGSSLMPQLQTVGGTVRVEGFYQFMNFFPHVQTITGSLEVISLRLLGCFNDLTQVGGDLTLRPKAFSPFVSLNSVLGTVRWENAGGPTLNIANPIVNAHGLSVTDNGALNALDPDVHIVGAGPISIQNNPLLPTCAAMNYVSAQTAAGWTGAATVVGNAIGSCP